MTTTVIPPQNELMPAVRVGADLRAARERLGLSLQDVAHSLRIRLPHLEALEAGRMSALPGDAYALAFVRTYAAFLGLDAEATVRRFKPGASGAGRRTALVFPVPLPERGVPAGAVLLLGLVLAIGTYSAWYRLSGEGRLPAETVTAIPERLASLAEQALPLSTAPKSLATANAPRPSVVAEAPKPETTPDPAPPAMAISPTSAAAAQFPPQPVAPQAVTAPAAEATRIVLRATADAWLQVKDRSGAILLNRTMKAGESWPVPARSDLLLTTGNAGGTEVVVDGTVSQSLGGSGAVRRDLPLDPDQIKDGRLAIAATPQLATTRARQ